MSAVGVVRDATTAAEPLAAVVGGDSAGAMIVENFEVLAGAEGSRDRLRTLVLNLAVRGKLTTQEATDEPAETLLARLRAAVGPAASIASAEVPPTARPFGLPTGWRWARFTDVASIASRLVPPAKFQTLPHVAPDNIEKGTGRLLQYRTIREDGVTSVKHRFFPGQILYSKIRPNLSKVVLVDFEGLCSADMYPLTARIDSGFLLLFLLSEAFLHQVVREDNRLAMPKVNQDQLSATVVAVPPLAEQKRIVAKVDQLMVLCDELDVREARTRHIGLRLTKSALDALASSESGTALPGAWRRVSERMDLLVSDTEAVQILRETILALAAHGRLSRAQRDDAPAALLVAAVRQARIERGKRGTGRATREQLTDVTPGEMSSAPPHWRWERLGNIADVVGGVTKGRDLSGRKTAMLPYLRVANVQRGYLDLAVMKEIEVGVDELDRFRLLAGDVLFTEGGDWDKLGRSAVWGAEIAPCVHQNHVFRARLEIGELEPRWFSLFANSSVGRAYFQEAAKQTTNLASINMTQLRNFPVPVPPTAEQARIVETVGRLMALCDRLEEVIQRAEDTRVALANAIVGSAFAQLGAD